MQGKRFLVVRLILTLGMISFLFCSAAQAEAPNLLTYQGRLTDDNGNPVADDSYLIKIKIYGSESGDDSLWSSGFRPVDVTDGLFEYQLGSVVPLPVDIFADDTVRYLGITVGAGSEMTPRKRILSNAYAMSAREADLADTALAVRGEPYLKKEGDTLKGTLDLGGYGGEIYLSGGSGNLRLKEGGDLRVQMYGVSYGSLYLYDNSATRTAIVDARSGSGGYVHLDMPDGSNDIILSCSGTGSSSAIFPDDAVDALEMLNEPGITYSSKNAMKPLPSDEMIDVDTVRITIPSAGYILVQAKAYAYLYGTTGQNIGYAQIDETEGGGVIYPYACLFGATSYLTTGGRYFPLFVQRVYYKSAGSYTFRLEGLAFSGNGSGAATYINNPVISAVFYPTSYGSVASAVNFSETGEFEDVKVETLPDGNEVEKGGTVYTVNLQELELKAKEARLRAQEAYIEQLEAERELEQARRETHE